MNFYFNKPLTDEVLKKMSVKRLFSYRTKLLAVKRKHDTWKAYFYGDKYEFETRQAVVAKELPLVNAELKKVSSLLKGRLANAGRV